MTRKGSVCQQHRSLLIAWVSVLEHPNGSEGQQLPHFPLPEWAGQWAGQSAASNGPQFEPFPGPWGREELWEGSLSSLLGKLVNVDPFLVELWRDEIGIELVLLLVQKLGRRQR